MLRRLVSFIFVSAYSATFLILYVQHFIPVSNPLLCLPKLFVQIGMASLALFCGLSRISDHKHHGTDVLAGLILGVVVGAFIFMFILMQSCMPLLKIKENQSMESVYSTSTRGVVEDPPAQPISMVSKESGAVGQVWTFLSFLMNILYVQMKHLVHTRVI